MTDTLLCPIMVLVAAIDRGYNRPPLPQDAECMREACMWWKDTSAGMGGAARQGVCILNPQRTIVVGESR